MGPALLVGPAAPLEQAFDLAELLDAAEILGRRPGQLEELADGLASRARVVPPQIDELRLEAVSCARHLFSAIKVRG